MEFRIEIDAMKHLPILSFALVLLFAQAFGSDPAGPRFDNTGRLSEYVYSDGTKDQYSYDSAWRMIRITDRAGRITTFVYNSDGSMTVYHNDGSAAR